MTHTVTGRRTSLASSSETTSRRRPRRSAVALALACGWLAAAAPPAPAAAEDGVVRTRFALLSGRPGTAGEDSTSRGAVVVPGTVFRLGRAQPALGDTEARSRELAELGDRLRRTLRLEEVQTLYSQELSLAVDRRQELPTPTATSPIRVEVTLQGYNSQLATYRVRFRDARSTFADSVVSIEPRGRAVVGGLDGEEAPYLFLVIEPVSGPRWIRTVEEGITPPRPIERTGPQYTEEARKDRIQGVVILQTVIDETGKVREIETLKGLPGGLTEAATDAVRRWKFTPALDEEGKPVAVQYNMTVNFTLDSGDQATPKDGRPPG